MSIDTVRISAQAVIPSTRWADNEIRSTDIETGECKRKLITKGQGEEGKVLPRLTYYPEDKRLVAEVSLPKFICGENYLLLSDGEIREATEKLVAWSSDLVEVTLPDLAEWKVSRLDSCWCWPVGDYMQAYLEVLSQLPVYGYVRTSYTLGDNTSPGFTWLAKTLRVNAYDKGLESGKAEAKGLLRLETQALNGSACKTITHRQKVEQSAKALITGDVGRREVANWLKRVGMPETIPADVDLFSIIADKYDTREAASRWWFITLFRKMGYAAKSKISGATFDRHMTEARKSGWLASSPGDPLPGLKVGGCPQSLTMGNPINVDSRHNVSESREAAKIPPGAG